MKIHWLLTSSASLILLFMSEAKAVCPGCRLKGICACDDVKYDDITSLNASCEGFDSCNEDRHLDNLVEFNCNCDEFCVQLGTCCVDSKYRDGKTKPDERIACVETSPYKINTRRVFMVDSCPANWIGDSSVVKMCNSDGVDLDDPLLAIPVTNLKTTVTYKNYYCSVCNDDSEPEDTIFWDIRLESSSKKVLNGHVPELHYDSDMMTWTFNEGEWNISVTLTIVVPNVLRKHVYDCVPDVISSCGWNWTDSGVERKCHTYMAIARINKEDDIVTYRNPHCALCNFEDLSNLICSDYFGIALAPESKKKTFFVGIFSLHDKTKKCHDDMIWDSMAKKCRKTYRA